MEKGQNFDFFGNSSDSIVKKLFFSRIIKFYLAQIWHQ